ncbi:hypothetical protein ABE073_13070 [Lederbergia citrisecunda]|uniref:hypothetical protein n=1 Tax=Lederbergia citrisecunda TaxID=2833583 RepID=UPI00128FB4A2
MFYSQVFTCCVGDIDHFPADIVHFPIVIDQLSRLIVYFPTVIDHFPVYMIISGLMTHRIRSPLPTKKV